MRTPKTIVISCAGMGSRLGFGYPKALLEIAGKPIIAHHLELLKEFDDVRVVVGFEAPAVIAACRAVRPDVLFVFNHDYQKTNTLASLYLGAEHGRDLVVSVDGDLLVAPDDFLRFVRSDGEILGYTAAYSDDPVYVRTRKAGRRTLVTGMSRSKGPLEWSGLAQVRKERLRYGRQFVYQVLASALPLEGRFINCREVDTPDDLKRARSWAKGVFGGAGGG